LAVSEGVLEIVCAIIGEATDGAGFAHVPRDNDVSVGHQDGRSIEVSRVLAAVLSGYSQLVGWDTKFTIGAVAHALHLEHEARVATRVSDFEVLLSHGLLNSSRGIVVGSLLVVRDNVFFGSASPSDSDEVFSVGHDAQVSDLTTVFADG
jgi:hypothetical protein